MIIGVNTGVAGVTLGRASALCWAQRCTGIMPLSSDGHDEICANTNGSSGSVRPPVPCVHAARHPKMNCGKHLLGQC